MQPECRGVHLLLGQRENACSNVFERIELNLFESNNLTLHPNFTMSRVRFRMNRREAIAKLRQLTHLRVNNSVGKVIGINLPDKGFPPIKVKALHLELPRIV